MGGGGGTARGAGWAGRVVTSARKHWAPRLPLPCWQCGKPVLSTQQWVVEHTHPRSQGGSTTGVHNQWVSHRTCSDASGGRLAQANKRARTTAEQREFRDWTR